MGKVIFFDNHSRLAHLRRLTKERDKVCDAWEDKRELADAYREVMEELHNECTRLTGNLEELNKRYILFNQRSLLMAASHQLVSVEMPALSRLGRELLLPIHALEDRLHEEAFKK